MGKLEAYLKDTPSSSRILIGSDSERVKIKGVQYADTMIVVAVHIEGAHGCKVFGEAMRERDYDQRKDRPSMRLMNEVYKLAQLFDRVKDLIGDREVEVHLDINPDENHGSSCVVKEAIGYINAMTNIVPFVKPDAPAASFCADRGIDLIKNQ
jgi:predicted RNase H-related nuclease YkuK (DUF458 family)